MRDFHTCQVLLYEVLLGQLKLQQKHRLQLQRVLCLRRTLFRQSVHQQYQHHRARHWPCHLQLRCQASEQQSQNTSKDDPKFREIGSGPDSIVDVGVRKQGVSRIPNLDLKFALDDEEQFVFRMFQIKHVEF